MAGVGAEHIGVARKGGGGPDAAIAGQRDQCISVRNVAERMPAALAERILEIDGITAMVADEEFHEGHRFGRGNNGRRWWWFRQLRKLSGGGCRLRQFAFRYLHARQFATVDACVGMLPDGVLQIFEALRPRLRKLAPDAEEAIRYGMAA